MSTKSERKQRRREQERQKRQQKSEENPPPPAAPAPVETTQASKQVTEGQDVGQRPNQQNSGQSKWSVPWWIEWMFNPTRRALLFADIAFAGVIAAATCAQVYYGNKQWDATEKQWESMEKQLSVMRTDQRPWLDTSAVGLFKPDSETTWTIRTSNLGKSPAVVYAEKSIGFIIESPDALATASIAELARNSLGRKAERQIDRKRQNRVVFQGSPVEWPLKCSIPAWTEESSAAVANGDNTLVVVAEIDYSDNDLDQDFYTIGTWIYDPLNKSLPSLDRFKFLK